MRRLTFLLAACSVLFAACDQQEPALTGPVMEAWRPAAKAAAGALGTDRYVLLTNGRAVELDAEVAALGGTLTFQHEAAGIAVVSGLSPDAAATLAQAPGVSSVQPDAVVPFVPVAAGEPQAVDAASVSNPASAFFYGLQWNMRAIGADAAWAAGRLGSPDVTVAILDSGIDYVHPDLSGRVDLARSVSFIPAEDAVVRQLFPDRHLVTDLHYHGTHVAATVASNAVAAAGVTSQATLMGVKVCSSLPQVGGCPMSAVLQGVLYAADNGADVINISLGAPYPKSALGWVHGYINQTFNYAHRKGVTVVAAAGNGASDLQHNANLTQTYCEVPHAICVSATGPTGAANVVTGPWHDVDTFASYSNYGRNAISVAAPGGTKFGRVYAACSTSSLTNPGCQNAVRVIPSTGTSMAAAHVAGLAALLVERHGRNPAAIRRAIEQSADDFGESGSEYYGSGRINVPAALGL